MKSLILSCSALVLFAGCCPKPEPMYVDRVVEVKVPVKCVVEMPKYPVAGENTAESVLNIKEWVLLVNEAVKSCK
jgi:hypothetical protein